jgi:hypothetical protein
MNTRLLKFRASLLSGCLLLAVMLVSAEAAPADVKSALSLIRQWQLEQTSYHLRMNIDGQYLKQEVNLYCHPAAAGARIWKADTRMIKPDEAHVIFEQSPGDIVAYFPETEHHVLTKALPGYADILSATFVGLTDEDRTLEKTKSSSLLSIGDINQVTLVFDAGKLGVNPPKQDIRTIIRFDNTGKILEVEQRRLGLITVCRLTYLTFNIDEVRARMPVTPDPLLADPNLTFQQAMEDNIIYFAKERQLRQNRL